MACYTGDTFVAFFKGSQELRFCHWGIVVINQSLLDSTLIHAVGNFEDGWVVEKKPYAVKSDGSLCRLVHIGRMSEHNVWLDALKDNVRITAGDRAFDCVVWVKRAIEFLGRNRKVVVLNNNVNGAIAELSNLALTAASRTRYDFQTIHHCKVPEYGKHN